MYKIERQCFYKLVTTQKEFDEFVNEYKGYDYGIGASEGIIFPSIIEYTEDIGAYDYNHYLNIIRTYTKDEFISYLQECIKELQDDN
jgi:hypothetical protein